MGTERGYSFWVPPNGNVKYITTFGHTIVTEYFDQLEFKMYITE